MVTLRNVRALTHSPQETGSVAAQLARAASAGHVLALVGGLGAGKTVFTRAFAKALGVRSRVTSPTFIVVAAHPARFRSIRVLHHIDFYRLASVTGRDLEALVEAITDPRAICLIEWADRIGNLKKLVRSNKFTTIRFRVAGERTRVLSIRGALGDAMRAWRGSPASPIRRGSARRRPALRLRRPSVQR